MLHSARLLTPLLCVAALLLAFVPLFGAVSAQSTVTGELTGVTVTAGEKWMHDANASMTDETVDSLVFVHGNANVIVTSYLNGMPDVYVTNNLVPQDAAINPIDGSDSYLLLSVDANGRSYGVFSVVVGSEVQTVIAPPSGFAEAVASAQSGIQVNGAAVLDGVDGVALNTVIALMPIDPAADADLPPLLGDVGHMDVSDADATTEETATDTVAESAPVEAGATGFVDEHTWVSPMYGTKVAWGDAWEAADLGNTGGPSVATMDTRELLCLTRISDTEANARFCVDSYRMTEGSSGTQSMAEKYAEPGSKGLPYFSVAVTETTWVAAETSVTMDDAVILSGWVAEDVSVTTRLHGHLEMLPASLEYVQSEITVNDEPALSLVDPATFQADVDEMVALIPGYVEQRDAKLKELGLVDPNHFVSVATGCDVAWTSPLDLKMGSTMTPISARPVEGSGSREIFALTLPEAFLHIDLQCYSDAESWNGDGYWAEDNLIVVEGANIRYAYHDGMPGYVDLIIVVASADATGLVEITISGDRVALEGLQPGTFTINGVDIFQAMDEDNLWELLP